MRKITICIDQCFSAAGPRPGTGPSSYEERIYRAAVSQRLRTTGIDAHHLKLVRHNLKVDAMYVFKIQTKCFM
jgi:hypothetical protein